MPSLDAENNTHALNQHHHTPQSSTYQPSDFKGDQTPSFEDGIPPLSDNVYKPSHPRRPFVSTNFGKSSPKPTGTAQNDVSPDPREYYRSKSDRLGRESSTDGGSPGSVGQPNGRRQATSPRYRNGDGRTITPIASRINTAQFASSNHERSPLSAAKSSPTLSSTARNRQTSLQDLVNKFNQTPDEVPPLPKKTTSRSPSASSVSRSQGMRSRTASQARATGGRLSSGSLSSDNMSVREAQTRQQERARPRDGRPESPKFKKDYNLAASEAVPAKPFASEGMADLAPEMMTLPRRPLFGEVVTSNVPQANIGYGIPVSKRRRGSEGSLHSPRTLYSDQDYLRRRDQSPDSPSAWYYNTAPPLEEIKAKGEIPEPPPHLHRRTRSDLHGMPSSPVTSRKYTNNLSPPSSPIVTETPRRTSQSRIPVSSRRFSANSDSGNSVPSTRKSSVGETAPTKLSTRTRAPPPKPLQTTRVSPRYSRSNTPQKSPRYQNNISRSVTSPGLPAYISEPPPKKSPPLRSSRPRQPVSSATTSASRARTVEKFSGESSGARSLRESRPKKPPELGALDFAARRQKIQQAFTKSVREEEEREIRRASIARELSTRVPPSVEIPADDVFSTQHTSQADKQLPTGEGSKLLDPTEAEKERLEGLSVQTGHLAERSVLDLSMEDSPTLGTFNARLSQDTNGYEPNHSTPNSEIDPGSAITAGTEDSVDTFFDDEPQDQSRESSRRPSTAQPTLLKNIMALRSPTNPSASEARERAGTEDQESGDDRESIQIMLGATPVLEKRSFHEDNESRSKEAASSEDPDSRWSMSSWTSSNRSRDDKEAYLERVEEHPSSHTYADAHTSVSTSASEHTEPVWSPASYTSPTTDRTTLGSDRYSTVNRVLDQYHDPDVPSPDGLHDSQYQMYNRSPELARQGGYDPRKVTQLYLQKIARDRNVIPSAMPEDIKAHINKRTSSLPVPGPVSEKEVRDDMDEKILPSIGHNRNLSATSAIHDVDDEGNLRPARASLSRPDDFDMSPSLGGFAEQAADTPYEERPPPPEKDRPVAGIPKSMEHYEGGRGRLHPSEDEFRPQLPPINFGGQSLAINVEPPRRSDSPFKASQPAPKHSPPPPPIDYRRPLPEPSSETPRAIRPINVSKPSDESGVSREEASMNAESASQEDVPTPEQKRLTRRRHIIKELVDTEHSFGQDMRVLEDIYRGTSNVIISADDVKTLFGNSGQIIEFSTQFLDSLKQASRPVYALSKAKRWKSNRASNATANSGTTGDDSSINGLDLTDDEKDRKTFVGETFGHHMAAMEKTYTEYLKNHDAANQKLTQLLKNQKVQIWLKECRAYATDLTAAWDLGALIVKPTQRVLKYPLLLDSLVEVTPENHPDFTALDVAAREMKGVSMRINEAKRRADILETVTSSSRKRKESDMRTGLAKAFGAGKKLRQQVGSVTTFEDKIYTKLVTHYAEHFVRLQVVMRDVEMYTGDVEVFVKKFLDFAIGMEAYIDVGQTSYPELESKWHKFRMSMRDMSTMALPDHVDQVRKHVVQPMTTLVKLHEGPQKLIQKRDKRLPDYARYKSITERGDKPDKKTAEQGEQFLAVNGTLKDELPKLFTLTGKLMERCLSNFVELQFKWLKLWKLKLKQAIDIRSATQDGDFQEELEKIVKGFYTDYAFHEAQVSSLGLVNGALLYDTPNFIPFDPPSGVGSNFTGGSSSTLVQGQYEGTTSPRTGPSFDSTRRTMSVSSDRSPVLPQPDFGDYRPNGSFFTVGDASTPGPFPQRQISRRNRAISNVSNNGPQTPYPPGSWRSYSNNTTPINSTPGRPPTATGRIATDPAPSLRPSMESSRLNRLSDDSALTRPSPGVNYTPSTQPRSTSPSGNRFSGYFSSAMPMSDSPPTHSPTQGPHKSEYNVIFLAASVYEFNIDRARKEAGYPYLTYVAGEIFDVIGEKGELWLARNQDDPNSLVGWIWNKHFVKLAG